MDPAELPQQFDGLRVSPQPPPGFSSKTYLIRNIALLQKQWRESCKPIPVTELQAYLSSIAAIQAYNLNFKIRDPETCAFATQILKALEAKACELNPNTYPYIIEQLITLCLADPASKRDNQNLFAALANRPIGAHHPRAVLVALCNGHQFFDFPQPGLFSSLRELVVPHCTSEQCSASDTPLTLTELLTITIAFAKFRCQDSFVTTLQGLLKRQPELQAADTDKLTRLSVSLSRHPDCDQAFVIDLLHILMNRSWSENDRKVNRILYTAANLSNPPRSIQERLCSYYEAKDQKLLKITQLAALSRLPMQQETGRKFGSCHFKPELHRQLMAIIQEHTLKLKHMVTNKTTYHFDSRASHKIIKKIQNHFSEFTNDDLHELIDCLISISRADQALGSYAEKQFRAICAKAHDVLQTPTLLTSLCKGHIHFQFPDQVSFSRLQGSIEYHCENGKFSTADLLVITTAYASNRKNNGFLAILQCYLKQRGDLASQDQGLLIQAIDLLSTHLERDEELIATLLQPKMRVIGTLDHLLRLTVLNAVGRLANAPQALQEALCKYYFDETGFTRSSLNEVALVSRLPLVQEEHTGQKLQRIKEVMHSNLARCEKPSLAALIIAFTHAKKQDNTFLDALYRTLCQEEETTANALPLEEKPVGVLFSLAKQYSQRRDAASLRLVIQEFLRRQAEWESLLWKDAIGFQASLKIEEEEILLHAPLNVAACSVLLGHCMQTSELEEALQDLIDLLQNGRLAGRYRLPSDHLPIGACIAGIKLMSWNVLNSAYMDWITKGTCTMLKNSLITHLDTRAQLPLKNEDKGLTNRDIRVARMIVAAIRQGMDIFALQECSEPFLKALAVRLPQHFKIVKKCDYPAVDQEVFVYNSQRLLPRLDLNTKQQAFYKGTPDRKIFSFAFEIVGASHRILRLFNAHVPAEAKIKGHEQFASHVAASCWPDEIVCAVGDFNYEQQEVLQAFHKAKLHVTSISPWDTNIGPDKRIKAIDHILVQGAVPIALRAEELLPKTYLLQDTVNLLIKKKSHAART